MNDKTDVNHAKPNHGNLVNINGTVFDTDSAYISFQTVRALDNHGHWVGGEFPGTLMPIASARIFSLRGNPYFNKSNAAATPWLLPYSFNWADLNS